MEQIISRHQSPVVSQELPGIINKEIEKECDTIRLNLDYFFFFLIQLHQTGGTSGLQVIRVHSSNCK